MKWPDRTRLVDVAVALGFVLLTEAEVWGHDLAPKTVAVPATLAMSAAMLWRRRSPLATAAVVAGLLVLQTAAGVSLRDQVAPLVFGIVVAWSVAAYERRTRAVAGLAIVLAGLSISMRLASGNGERYVVPWDYVWVGIVVGVPWLVGLAFAARGGSVRALREQTAQLEREQEIAIRDERARIARELHDAIGHAISVMTIQAGAAEQLLKREPDRALEPILAIQEAGRQALSEMKRVLGMLREDDAEIGAPFTPQPRLADLDKLVARVTEAGLPVTVDTIGEPAVLPPGLDMSAYRIIQEALTNALKHSGASHAAVRLGYEPDEIVIEVSDNGRGSTHVSGVGHGLAGMRERTHIFGGELTTNDPPDGGFVVRAILPLQGDA